MIIFPKSNQLKLMDDFIGHAVDAVSRDLMYNRLKGSSFMARIEGPSSTDPCDGLHHFRDAMIKELSRGVLGSEKEGSLIIRLLRLSPTFRTFETNLNGRYVLHLGPCWNHHCIGVKCERDDHGVVVRAPAKSKLRGRVGLVILNIGPAGSRGSHFEPAISPENPTANDRIFIQSPPSGTPRNQRLGMVIERTAHETFHAFRHLNPSSPAPKTMRQQVETAISEEIEARKTEKRIITEILGKPKRSKALSGFITSDQRVFENIGFRLTNRFLVERARFPGILHLTYMERFALSALMQRAIDQEGLSTAQVQTINERVKKDTDLDFHEIWELRDGIRHSNDYETLRILAHHMDKEWRKLSPGSVEEGTWDASDEHLLQMHACLFRRIIGYTPHPDPKIRRTICRTLKPGARPVVSVSCVPRKLLRAEAAASVSTDLCISTVPTPGAFYQIQYGDSLFGTAARAYKPVYDTVPIKEKVRMTKLINRHPYNMQFWNKKLSGKIFRNGRISYGKKFRGVIELPPRALGKALRGRKYAVIYIPKLS